MRDSRRREDVASLTLPPGLDSSADMDVDRAINVDFNFQLLGFPKHLTALHMCPTWPTLRALNDCS